MSKGNPKIVNHEKAHNNPTPNHLATNPFVRLCQGQKQQNRTPNQRSGTQPLEIRRKSCHDAKRLSYRESGNGFQYGS